jgi:isoquinoline 1-oxidoreductase alpha subunit
LRRPAGRFNVIGGTNKNTERIQGIATAVQVVRDRRISVVQLTINGKTHEVDADPDTPLLWVIREQVGLTGTKFGCGIAQCGACTVHLDGVATRSCVMPLSAVTADQKIVTIEGLSPDSSHPVQKAWAALDVPQCGYCQSGQIMAAVALLQSNPNPTDDDINTEMSNICRCGTYNRIRAAIKMAAGDTGEATRG